MIANIELYMNWLHVNYHNGDFTRDGLTNFIYLI